MRMIYDLIRDSGYSGKICRNKDGKEINQNVSSDCVSVVDCGDLLLPLLFYAFSIIWLCYFCTNNNMIKIL